jgi:hypothetical protein
MAQTFTLDRHTDPLNPTAVPANNELIKNYETISDMEGDLTNVDDGEVISTEEADYTSVHISDEVTDGDLNPVTSNAVYDAIEAAKIDRVKGAFVEERTNKLWTDGRPIYRQYAEGTPEPGMSEDRKTFMLYAPVSSAGAVKVVDMYGYWEITENTSFPQIVGTSEQISSTAMTPNRVHATSMCSTASWDPRYPAKIAVGVSVNATTSYGLSEHIKICAVIEYTKMSDTPVEDPGVGPLTPSSGNIAGVIVNDGIHYSTTETPTGSTWIDGKPVYRITVDTPWMTTYTETNAQRAYTHLLTNLGISNIVSMSGMISYHTVNSPSSLGRFALGQPLFFSTGSDVGLTSYATASSISIVEFSRWGGGLVDCKATATIEYTKA